MHPYASTPLFGSAASNSAFCVTQVVQSFNVTTPASQLRAAATVAPVRTTTVALRKGAVTAGPPASSAFYRFGICNGRKEEGNHTEESCFRTGSLSAKNDKTVRYAEGHVVCTL